jgi:hypothetical protein
MIPLVIANIVSEIKSTGFIVAKQYLQFCGLHFFNVPIHHAPFNEQIFLRKNQDRNLVAQKLMDIIINTQNTPPVFSKIFLYNLYNLIYPKGRTPYFFYRYISEISNKYAKSQIQFMQASTIYDKTFYFYPIEGWFNGLIHRILLVSHFREAYGIFSKIGASINKFVLKHKIRKNRIFYNGTIDFFYKYYFKKESSQNLFRLETARSQEKINFLNTHWKLETDNFINYITQFLVEMKGIISNIISMQVVNVAFDLLDRFVPLGKNARSAMFYELRNKKTLRDSYFSRHNRQQILSYFQSFDHCEESYQNLKRLKDNAKTIKEKKAIAKMIEEEIKFPRLLMVGKDAETESQKFCYYINFLVKSYTVYFDCVALKNSFKYLSGSPEASQASFLTRLFNIIRNNVQLKKIFSDTKHLEYRLDLLIFNDVTPLMKNRFGDRMLTISDLLAITMFLETISYGYRSTYLFTVPHLSSKEIDMSVMNMVDFCINLADIDKKITFIKTKRHLIDLYQTDFKKCTTIKLKNLILWTNNVLKKNPKLEFEALALFFYQIQIVAEKQKISIDEEILNLLAKYLKIIA